MFDCLHYKGRDLLDKPIEEHIALTQMVIDIAQRKVESGKDVVILLDSITRMARAFNNQLKSSGRTLSGGSASNFRAN